MTVGKTVRPMPSDRCPVCLSVCDACVLWPNGWMDQDETWHGGRPHTWPHCVRWGPSCPSKWAQPQFSAHVCCGQLAGWIKMPLDMEVDLCPGQIVLDGDPTPPKEAQQPRLLFGRCHLLWTNGCPSRLLLSTCPYFS